MIIKKTVYFYSMKDANGDVSTVLVDDPSDNICIGGKDSDGKYHQYDSYEAYYLSGWAEEKGFEVILTVKEVEIDVSF